MKKIIFYVPDSPHAYIYKYFCFFAMYINRNYPIDAAIVGDYEIKPDVIEDELKKGTIAVFVDGIYLTGEDPKIGEFLSKYRKNIVFWYKRPVEKCIEGLNRLKGNKVIVSYKEDIDFLNKYFGIKAQHFDTVAIGPSVKRDVESRARDVVYFGTYMPAFAAKKTLLDSTPTLLEKMVKDIMSVIDDNAMLEVTDIIKAELDKHGKSKDKALFIEFMSEYGAFFDSYRDAVLKEKVLTALLNNGCILHLCGVNWKSFKNLAKKNAEHIILSQLPVGVESMSTYASNGTFVLSTNIRDGADTNICEGLKSGSTVIAADTEYNRKHYADKDNVILYNLNDLKKLTKEAKAVLRARKENNSTAIDEDCIKELVESFMSLLYDSKWKESILKDAKKNAIKTKEFSYLKIANNNVLIIGKDDSLSSISGTELKFKYAPNTVKAAAVVGIDNPFEAMRLFGNVIPYRIYLIPDNFKRANAIIEEFSADKRFGKHLKVFKTKEELKEYLLKNDDEFLPRLCYGEEEYFKSITKELHEIRLRSKRSSKVKPILSVAIPSLNRGSFALKAIKNLMNSEFDSEIEFVVSVNKSERDTEGYNTICKINDSRIHCSKAREYGEFSVSITRAIKLARGSFVLIQSDEDKIVTSALPFYMDKVVEYPTLGFIVTSGTGTNGYAVNQQSIDMDVPTNVHRALNLTYVTGIMMNRRILTNKSIDELTNKYENNLFYIYYAHLVYLLSLASRGPVLLSFVKIYECLKGDDVSEGLLRLNDVNNRIEMCRSSVEIVLNEVNTTQEELVRILSERVSWCYYIMCVAYNIIGESLTKRGRVFEEDINTVDEFVAEYMPTLSKYLVDDYYDNLVEEVKKMRKGYLDYYYELVAEKKNS